MEYGLALIDKAAQMCGGSYYKLSKEWGVAESTWNVCGVFDAGSGFSSHERGTGDGTWSPRMTDQRSTFPYGCTDWRGDGGHYPAITGSSRKHCFPRFEVTGLPDHRQVCWLR